MSAIVIVDVQKGFIKPEYAHIPEKIREHIEKKDYEHVIFGTFVNHKESNFERLLGQTNFYDRPETDIVTELVPFLREDAVFTRTAYSLFKAPGFEDYLKQNKIRSFDLCGLVADSCVLATAFEAFDLGYEACILRDLMATKENLAPVTEQIFKRNIDKHLHAR